jgi:hypothetical protein
MKTSNRALETYRVNTRVKLGGIWITLMLLYIYCDIYSFHRPGYVDELIAGRIGPFKATQEVLTIFGLLMIIPALMILACLFLKFKVAKWVNIIVSALYLVVNISNLIGESWIYYWIFAILEILLTISVIVLALKWKEDIS